MATAAIAAPEGKSLNLRFVDWIWHVRGSLPLAPGQSADDALDRLDPLFRVSGTRRERVNGTLTFTKKDQAAQDKMSIFDGGTLRVERGAGASMLRYHMTSRALLFCFLAPFMFLAIAQLTIVVTKYQKSEPEAKSAAAKKTPPKVMPMNPIDKFLGAPEPEKPGKDGAEKGGRRSRKPSPTPAYVFAGIFATLYVIGRILEDRLIRNQFRRRLLEA